MKKIIVIGCPGSGKSTFARKLHKATRIPLFHLDMLYWNADKTTVSRQVFLQRLEDAMTGEEWIIDGNFNSTIEARLQKCDTVFFLDLPIEVCLSGIEERKGKPRDDMPWVESDGHRDEEFILSIKNFSKESRPNILALFEKYKDKKVIVFRSRHQADEFINSLI